MIAPYECLDIDATAGGEGAASEVNSWALNLRGPASGCLRPRWHTKKISGGCALAYRRDTFARTNIYGKERQ